MDIIGNKRFEFEFEYFAVNLIDFLLLRFSYNDCQVIRINIFFYDFDCRPAAVAVETEVVVAGEFHGQTQPIKNVTDV